MSVRHNARRLLAADYLAACGVFVLLAGCTEHIETRYGERESASVNGTKVLSQMFEKAGHRVSSWHSLSPRLDEADCIVWFPDDFQPPSVEVRGWLEKWLADTPDRTLVYVGRDFSAAPWYWEHVLPDAPPDQRDIVRRRLAEAKANFTRARSVLPKSADAGWFTIDSTPPLRKPRRLSGEKPWTEGIDAGHADIELRSRLTPPRDAEIWLKSDDDVLVSRQAIEEGKLIVVANGSFVLNLPLVNHEHRRLAAKLIESIGPPKKAVVFLEGGRPPIRRTDPKTQIPTGLEIFNVWPTNWILLQAAVVGVIFCFSRWPIFGRPRSLETVAGSDFGRHIDGLANLLRRGRDRIYAKSKVLTYRQKTGQGK
jgi:hypothetical protein